MTIAQLSEIQECRLADLKLLPNGPMAPEQAISLLLMEAVIVLIEIAIDGKKAAV